MLGTGALKTFTWTSTGRWRSVPAKREDTLSASCALHAKCITSRNAAWRAIFPYPIEGRLLYHIRYTQTSNNVQPMTKSHHLQTWYAPTYEEQVVEVCSDSACCTPARASGTPILARSRRVASTEIWHKLFYGVPCP